MTDPDGPSAAMSAGSLGSAYDRLPPAIQSVVQRDLLPRYTGIAPEAPEDNDDELSAARGILVGFIRAVPCPGAIAAAVWWLVG